MTKKGQTPAQKKESTSTRVNKKIAVMREAIRLRKKDRFAGLPKSMEAFYRWRGDDAENPLDVKYVIHRQTVESRSDLKAGVKEVVEERNTKQPEVESLEKDARIRELEAQLKGLASENHKLHISIEALQDDVEAYKGKLKGLEKAGTPKNVVEMREREK